jgi:hypothetical protein
VIGVKTRKILFIKKMAERAVSDIMKKPGQPKELLNVGERGKFCFEDLEEGRIDLLRESPCDMQGPEGVLKTSMFGRREHPAGALELEDSAKPLKPGRIDRVSFCFLSFDPVRHHNVMINRVGDQSGSPGVLCLFHARETPSHDS